MTQDLLVGCCEDVKFGKTFGDWVEFGRVYGHEEVLMMMVVVGVQAGIIDPPLQIKRLECTSPYQVILMFRDQTSAPALFTWLAKCRRWYLTSI
jgi:hypothetical protein